MVGHGLTCGSVTGELTGCNGRIWVNLWVCDWEHNARTWVNLWVCDWGTHGVQW